MIGRTLAHYRVTGTLGAGGMGEVFRATDLRLGREVAIKTLPEEFARDPGRAARFEHEARTLAALSHPRIAALHGLEESDGVRFLVMELVGGETLAERLARGPIPIEEALPLATQIAEALEAAHEKGIVHRDLKPANVKVTPEGSIKVLDFGLAKALAEESDAASKSMSPTLTAAATRAGVILGTAAYMSPEQARGRKVDRRADVWAFGCVLYEMLTGRQAFGGETISDSISNVLTREPDWQALPATTPAPVRRMLRRCLEKQADRRLRD
ncbi:MAG TPA: serine/threonine-protein kinase, partial [Dongiaceae bacterium]|nr:serine/threonine-protein kinase [Dongiaceae bacterium]